MKTIVSRKGSKVVIRDSLGKLWLTRRKKLRHDNRRRRNTRGCTVIHIPICRILEKGDWLFTCNLVPLQFGETIPATNREGYSMTDEEWEEYKDDHFVTLEGSHHSRKACGCTPISDEYAKFFMDHTLWLLYRDDFEQYEKDVQTICKLFKIKYEGI